MNEEVQIKEFQFLLDLVISKLIDITGVKDYPDFILRYRLSENNSIALMDEISAIEQEVKQGKTVESNDILNRLGGFHLFGSPGPITFVREVLEILSPEILLRIYNGDHS
jgi:hypothetical protein